MSNNGVHTIFILMSHDSRGNEVPVDEALGQEEAGGDGRDKGGRRVRGKRTGRRADGVSGAGVE